MAGGSGGSGEFVSEVMDALGHVMDFLGGGVGGDLVDAAVDSYKQNEAMNAAAAEFGVSLSEAGNEGQIAILNELGEDAYRACAQYGFENEGDTSGFLTEMASHPEAVEEILGNAEEAIADIVEGAMD